MRKQMKLKLAKETLRYLDQSLASVRGGYETESCPITHAPTCYTCKWNGNVCDGDIIKRV